MINKIEGIIFQINKNKCCGCTACYAICPQDAISMQEDEEGFDYPSIDEQKCRKCGLCVERCPNSAIKM